MRSNLCCGIFGPDGDGSSHPTSLLLLFFLPQRLHKHVRHVVLGRQIARLASPKHGQRREISYRLSSGTSPAIMVQSNGASDISTEENKVKEIPSHEEQQKVQSRSHSKCNYMHKGRDHYPVPVVDLKNLKCDSDPKLRAAVLEEIKEAAKVGAFCVVNHGIDEKLVTKYRESVIAFFSQPYEEKVKSAKIPVPGCSRAVGYQGQFKNLTQKAFIVQRREVFEIQGSPAVDCDSVPWPESVPSLRGHMEPFAREIGKLSRWVCEALAEALGLSRDAFLKQLIKGVHQQIVACSYPVPEKQPQIIVNPSSIGFGAHSDLPVMNVVVEDSTGGVQVWHDDQWLNTTPIPEGVSYFLGDPMECMSNGIYHSMIHRVVAPKSNSRFSSVATFEPVDKETTVIYPVPELVEMSGQPAKYIPFNFGGRAKSIMFQRFDPEIMTKKFMVTDFSVLNTLRNFSYRDGVFHIGSRPLGSASEGY